MKQIIRVYKDGMSNRDNEIVVTSVNATRKSINDAGGALAANIKSSVVN
jgi:hypothetical protein